MADEVTVARNVLPDAELRHEAVRGVRDALRQVTADLGSHRVTVVDALTTEVDTGVGDVYEATFQAVRQALSLEPALSVGFSDPQIVTRWLRDRIGRRLVEVTEARYWFSGEPELDTAASLIHAWLHFDPGPPIKLHGLGDTLLLSTANPYPAYEMGQYGEVRVGPARAPDLLAGVVGRRLNNAAVIVGGQTCAGLLLRLDDVDVVIGTFCDQWVLARDQPPAHLAPYWNIHAWITAA